MSGQKVFDSHFHIFDLEVRAKFPNQNVSMGFPSEAQAKINRTHTASEAEESLKSAGISEAVFVQCYNDCPEEIEFVLNEFKDKKFVKGLVGGLDPTNLPKLEHNLSKYCSLQSPKFVGVRHLIGLEDNNFSLREDFHRGLQVLADHDLTFDLHSYPDTIKFIPVLAEKVPKLRMVIDHIAKPYYDKPEAFSEWCTHMTNAAKYPNVYCKLSGLINEIPDWSVEKFQPYVDHCLKVFGVERCMYGSDWPVCKLAEPSIQYKDVVGLMEGLLQSLTQQEKDDIFYNNAKKFYKID